MLENNVSESSWLWYLKQSLMEEMLFRALALWIFPNLFGVLMFSCLIYSLVHLIKFKWYILAPCFVFGFVQAFVFAVVSHEFGWTIATLVCTGLHFVIGAVSWDLFLCKWTRQ